MNHTPDLLEDPAPLLTPAEAADRLAVSAKTLERWRSTGDGPPYIALGRRLVRYRRADVDAFVRRQKTANTAQRRQRTG